MLGKRRLCSLACSALAALLPLHAPAQTQLRQLEAIYTMSNSPEGNRVLQFTQGADGRLKAGAQFASGGRGSGGGLGNQGALANDGEFLLVVNAGSDDVSVFRKHGAGLRLVDRVASGGLRPVSIAIDRALVYVLNAGSDSIAGFTLSRGGVLQALPGSEQPLSGESVGAAQIGFSRDGRTLIVTEKATSNVVTFSLDRRGLPLQRQVFASPGQTPFGFALTHQRQMLVSEAAAGAAGAGSVTSWRIRHDGSLRVLDGAVPTTQSAACWVAVTPNGRFAYATNTASGTLSRYRLLGNGQLILQDAAGVAASTGAGSAPIDLIFSQRGRYLHVLNAGSRKLTTFAVGQLGQLTHVADVDGLPIGTNGLTVF